MASGSARCRLSLLMNLAHAFRGCLCFSEVVVSIDSLSNAVHEGGLQHDGVLVQVVVELFCAQHLGNLDQLILVVLTVEEGLPPEDLRG